MFAVTARPLPKKVIMAVETTPRAGGAAARHRPF
jgi:hypothetical protein